MAESNRAWLRCPTGPLRGDRHEIANAVSIGRTAFHDIVLDHKLISSDHARIEYDPKASCFVIEDLGSTNGTRVDGVAVRSRIGLGHLHVISFSDVHEFVFVDPLKAAHRHGIGVPDRGPAPEQPSSVEDMSITREGELPQTIPGPLAAALAASTVAPPSNVEITSIIELPPAVPAALVPDASNLGTLVPEARVPETPGPAQPAPVLATPKPQGPKTAAPASLGGSMFALEVSTNLGVRRYPLSVGENVVGRSRDAAVRLSAPELSRRHAVLDIAGALVRLRDLGSRHKTHLEGHPIEAELAIEVGDRLRFGTIEARLVRAESED